MAAPAPPPIVPSPNSNQLCNDLGRFACAPGRYEDPTGVIPSQTEIDSAYSDYADRIRSRLRQRVAAAFDDEDAPDFRDRAISALGLTNSPDCLSEEPAATARCRANAIDGVVRWGEITLLASMGPMATRQSVRLGNTAEALWVLRSNKFSEALEDIRANVPPPGQNPQLFRRIETEVFPTIKRLMLERIERLDVSPEVKRMMTRRVRSIVFLGACPQTNADPLRDVGAEMAPNMFFNPMGPSFCVTPHMFLHGTSLFSIAYIVAHELSHAVDPCNLAEGPADMSLRYDFSRPREEQYPIRGLLNCLRDPRSFRAARFSPGSTRPPGAASSVSSSETEQGTQDQICEAFSDWLAGEVAPTYIRSLGEFTPEQARVGYSNVFRFACDDRQTRGEHPPTLRRINHGILVQPEVRRQMDCPPTHPTNLYCDADQLANAPDVPGMPAMGGGYGEYGAPPAMQQTQPREVAP